MGQRSKDYRDYGETSISECSPNWIFFVYLSNTSFINILLLDLCNYVCGMYPNVTSLGLQLCSWDSGFYPLGLLHKINAQDYRKLGFYFDDFLKRYTGGINNENDHSLNNFMLLKVYLVWALMVWLLVIFFVFDSLFRAQSLVFTRKTQT